jgi:type I restriction enzyme S subunit
VSEFEIPCPSIEVQGRVIKKYLSAKEKIIILDSELTVQNNILSKLRQSILQEAIEGKLTADWRKEHPVRKGNPEYDATALLAKIRAEKQKLIVEGKIRKEKPLAPVNVGDTPFALPEGWVWTKLGEIANIVRGGSPRPAGDLRYYKGRIPFLKVADLTGYQEKYCNSHTYTIKEAGLHKTRYVEANTLMLTNSGATLGIPRICTFPTTFNDGIAAFLDIDQLNIEFLFYVLREKSNYFLREAARGQGQPNLNIQIISETTMSLPSLAEQRVIVDRVEKLLEMVDNLETQVNERKEQTDMLLQAVLREAFEGRGITSSGGK